MSIVDLLRSLEEGVFEIVAWVMLLPKTFLRVIFSPFRSIEYVNEETNKETEKRFDEYLSPIIFWLLVAVIPSAYVSLSTSQPATANLASAIEESNLLQAVGIVLITPIMYMLVMEWANGRPIKKSNLRRQFYIQCYLISMPQLFYSGILLFATDSPYFLTYVLTSTILLLVYETMIFKSEMRCGWLKAIWLAVLPQLILSILSTLYFLVSA